MVIGYNTTSLNEKRPFPEHRFPNDFPNENTPEITQISVDSLSSDKRTFCGSFDQAYLLCFFTACQYITLSTMTIFFIDDVDCIRD